MLSSARCPGSPPLQVFWPWGLGACVRISCKWLWTLGFSGLLAGSRAVSWFKYFFLKSKLPEVLRFIRLTLLARGSRGSSLDSATAPALPQGHRSDIKSIAAQLEQQLSPSLPGGVPRELWKKLSERILRRTLTLKFH